MCVIINSIGDNISLQKGEKLMKKQILTLAIATFAFVSGMGLNSAAISKEAADPAAIPAGYKVAIVDVAQVVAASKEVQALRQEQESKMIELQKWLETVRADVQKQSTEENKQKLIKKYDEEFAKKQEAIKKNYASKLASIDKNISSVITKTAKEKGYNLVLSRGIVLYGGEDITSEIAKAVK